MAAIQSRSDRNAGEPVEVVSLLSSDDEGPVPTASKPSRERKRGPQSRVSELLDRSTDQIRNKYVGYSSTLLVEQSNPRMAAAEDRLVQYFRQFLDQHAQKSALEVRATDLLDFLAWYASEACRPRSDTSSAVASRHIRKVCLMIAVNQTGKLNDRFDSDVNVGNPVFNRQLKSLIIRLEKDGVLTTDSVRERLWVSARLMTLLCTDLLAHGLVEHDWTSIIQRTLTISLLSATGARAGDVFVSSGYDDDYCLKWRDLVVDRRRTGEFMLKVTLRFCKGHKKDDESTVHNIRQTNPEYAPGCPVRLLLIHALNTGAVAEKSMEAIEKTLDSDSLTWTKPNGPVFRSFRDPSAAASTKQVQRTMEMVSKISRLDKAILSHDFRRGAARDIALPAGATRPDLLSAGRLLFHSLNRADMTEKYVGPSPDNFNLRLKDHNEEDDVFLRTQHANPMAKRRKVTSRPLLPDPTPVSVDLSDAVDDLDDVATVEEGMLSELETNTNTPSATIDLPSAMYGTVEEFVKFFSKLSEVGSVPNHTGGQEDGLCSFSTNGCDERFSVLWRRLWHERTCEFSNAMSATEHKESPFEYCPICSARSKNVAALYHHMASSHEPSPAVCEFEGCGKKDFKNRRAYLHHLKSHRGNDVDLEEDD